MTDAVWRFLHRIAARLYDARNFVLRPRVTGAVVLVRIAGELLLVRSSYRPWYTVPGGRVAWGEDPLAAALRELAEEVGLAAAPGALRALGEFVVHHSNLEDHVHAFELRLDARPALRIDSREIVWAGFHDESALAALPLWPALPPILAGSHPGPRSQERGR
jgi:ADP-ribose pyrophosphatase YjhB (NUDIX family)